MKKRKKTLVIILVLLLLAIIITAAYLFFSHGLPLLNVSTASSITLEDNGRAEEGEYQSKSSEQILSELEDEQMNVTDKVSSSALFVFGEQGTVGSWVVENLISNDVIMQCEIVIADELIAKSVPIYPGEHIDSIKLLVDLNPGSYDAVAYMNYFSLDTKEYISKAGYKIKLIVS